MNRIPKIETLSLLLVFTYTAMHIPEEAFGGFPAFMADNWGILNIGYARWLFHNAVFFAPVLIAALVGYVA